MKNNICILFIVLLCFALVSIVNAFESPIYSLNMNVNVEGINVNIDSDIEFNITNETGETTLTSSGTGNIIYTNSPSGSSRNKKVLTNNLNTTPTENKESINLNYNSEETIPQETDNFVKSGAGVIILLILTITGLAVATVLFKKQHEPTIN